ncbi:MAG TPA: 5-(carboxyamino)imidazole ribonucleotide synthase [Mycobacteriales bacterium]
MARVAGRSAVVGMVGAGQLAQMTHQAAIDLGVELIVLAASPQDPAVRAGAPAVYGPPDSRAALFELAERSDVLTFDHEHVPTDLVRELAAAGHRVYPAAAALEHAQDKLLARQAFSAAGYRVPPFAQLPDDEPGVGERFAAEHGWPVVLKTSRGGYDGRGVEVVRDPSELSEVLGRWAGRQVLVEAHVPIAQELAVVGARTPSGRWVAYPVVRTTQRDGICVELAMPAPVAAEVADLAQSTARGIAEHIDAVGLIAVELFLDTSGDLVVNEIALRPHNSGHATIEAAVTSQFQNHLRAVLDWPLGATDLRVPAAAMVNVLGGPDSADPAGHLPAALAVEGANVHLYGKAPSPGRKLGHVTACGPDIEAALTIAREAALAVSGSSPGCVSRSGEAPPHSRRDL